MTRGVSINWHMQLRESTSLIQEQINNDKTKR